MPMFSRTLRIDYSWAIVAAAFVILFFSSSSRFAFGVMLKPMQDDLQWSRASLSLAPTLFMFLSAFAMPVAGRLADRYGFRAVLGVAIVLTSVGIGSAGWTHSKWQFFLLYGLVFAVGNGASSVAPVSVLVTRWFARRRGMAVSLAIAGAATGQLVVISVLSSLLEDLGWRQSYRILALSILVVTLPVVLLVVRSRPSGESPDSRSVSGIVEKHQVGNVDAAREEADTLPVATVLSSRNFLLMNAFYAICGFQDWLVGTHVVAFATDEGVGPVLAGNLLAIMGVFGMAGVLLSGYLCDRFGPARPTVMSFLLRIAIFSLVVSSSSPPVIVTFALLYGFTFMMTAPLPPVFIARYFGVGSLGALTGSVNMVHQMSGGLGAFVGGVIFDNFDSYYWAWVLGLTLSIVAVGASMLVQERRVPQMA